MTKNVKVAIVGAEFKEGVVRTVPSINDLVDQVFTSIQFEAYGTLVGLRS